MNPLNHFKEKKHPYIVITIMLVAIFGVYIWSDDGATVSAPEETQVAQVTYTPLAPLPGQNIASGDIFGYLQNLIFLGIGIAIVLAVLVIVVGGIQYMASDVFTKKEDAKTRMTMALAGLIIAFGGYLLLKTINPELVVFKFSPATLNIETKKPTDNIQGQIQKIRESGQTSGRFRCKNSLGSEQDCGKITNLPASSGKYFEVTEYISATTELRKAAIDGAKTSCKNLGGVEQERAGTFTCFIKK